MTRMARFEIDLALAQAMVEAAITAATSTDALVVCKVPKALLGGAVIMNGMHATMRRRAAS